MGIEAHRDFADMLDDLLAEHISISDTVSRPTIAFDYLSVADELHSGRIRVSNEAAASEYRQTGAIEAELAALLEETKIVPPTAESLSVEPETIAAELRLHAVAHADLGRLRRNFAMRNHPDLVAPHLRQQAMRRMQIANGLIDEAKQRALRATA